jgi:hypothetical protein
MSLVNLYNSCLRKLELLRLDKFEHIPDIDTMDFNSLLCKQGVFSLGFRVINRLLLFEMIGTVGIGPSTRSTLPSFRSYFRHSSPAHALTSIYFIFSKPV